MQDIHDGFDAFMEEYYKIMINYCISRSYSKYDAEDIVIEAFKRLWIKWNDRKSYSSYDNKKWIYNTICNIIKENHRNKKKMMYSDIDEHGDEAVESDFTECIIDSIYAKEFLGHLDKHLDEEEKMLLRLKIMDDMEYPELEKRLDIKYDTLRGKVHRLKEKIKKLIKNF